MKTRKTTTYHYYHAIAFKEDVIYAIFISFDDGLISHSQPLCLTLEKVNKVKDSTATIYDKDEKELIAFLVLEHYEALDKFDPACLEQKVKSQEFSDIIHAFTRQVNART